MIGDSDGEYSSDRRVCHPGPSKHCEREAAPPSDFGRMPLRCQEAKNHCTAIPVLPPNSKTSTGRKGRHSSRLGQIPVLPFRRVTRSAFCVCSKYSFAS